MNKHQKPLNIKDLQENISVMFENDLYSDSDLINIINQCGDYLNIISPKDYAKVNNVSCVTSNKETVNRKIVSIFNTKFISEIL